MKEPASSQISRPPVSALKKPPLWCWPCTLTAEIWAKMAAIVIMAVILLPVLTLLILAWPKGAALLAGSVRYVLPYAIRDSFFLSGGVFLLTLLIGTVLGALTTLVEFPGRKLMVLLAVMPVALPAYLLSYIMVEVHHAAQGLNGPTLLQPLWQVVAWATPEPRSPLGAVVIFSLVLYPYVFIAARIAFLAQPSSLFEVARVLGRSPLRAFISTYLPLAISSLLAGALLAVMETLNDIGASEYLGVRTLAFTIYTTWLNRGDIAGAAQLCLILIVIVLILSWATYRLAKKTNQGRLIRSGRRLVRIKLKGWQSAVAIVLGFLPIALGFIMPVLFLLHTVIKRELAHMGSHVVLWHSMQGSLILSALAACVTLAVSLMLLAPQRMRPTKLGGMAERVAGFGYALPGAVLALAIFVPAGWMDNKIDAFMRQAFGISTGLILSGSLILLTYGYMVRFASIALSVLRAGFERIPTSLDMAARTLGAGPIASFIKIPLRLNQTAILGALLLIFVDGIKELPLTLILRPLGFDTLATSLYEAASRGAFEEGAPQALIMIAFGMMASYVGLFLTAAATKRSR